MMNKIGLWALAASAALAPSIAVAQPVAAGHSWRGGAHPGNVVVRHGGGAIRHPGNVVVHHGGTGVHAGQHVRFHRFRPGARIQRFFFAPQFHVQNWQLYGFSQPHPGTRWIRHHDDAYLIDGQGLIRDTRYGLDWDRYGEQWEVHGGIPRYVGRGDYRPDGEDYAYVEGQSGAYAEGWDMSDYAHAGSLPYGPPPPGTYPMPHPGFGYGYGSAYGAGAVTWGTVGTVTIVETTTTVQPAAASYSEEVIEEVVHVQRPRVRRARRAPCNCPRPVRPPAGERG